MNLITWECMLHDGGWDGRGARDVVHDDLGVRAAAALLAADGEDVLAVDHDLVPQIV